MIEIREIAPGGNVTDFLGVVDTIYKDDPAYIRPLDMMVKEQLNPKKNPFFEHADAAYFVAYKNGKPVGRVSASIDREHLARYKDQTGFFGFVDTIDDPEVSQALLDRATAWLKGRGMKVARGPLSLSINEETGLLVEGFEHPPVFMNPHHRRYQGGLVEQAGFTKVKDVFGWKYEVTGLNARTKKAHEDMKSLPELTSRTANMKTLDKDVDILIDIFNDAWMDNWGFVPTTRKEVQKMKSDFKMILVPELTRLVFIDGEPAAVAVALPNLNELSRDLKGKLFPFGFAKLIYRLKVEGPKSGRLIILGIRKKFRHNKKYAALSLFMFAELHNSGKRIGVEWGELGWTLEDNAAVNTAIRLMGGKLYKRYRVYEKRIDA